MSSDHLSGPPPVSLLRRLLLLIGLVAGLAILLALVFGGALLVEIGRASCRERVYVLV